MAKAPSKSAPSKKAAKKRATKKTSKKTSKKLTAKSPVPKAKSAKERAAKPKEAVEWGEEVLDVPYPPFPWPSSEAFGITRVEHVFAPQENDDSGSKTLVRGDSSTLVDSTEENKQEISLFEWLRTGTGPERLKKEAKWRKLKKARVQRGEHPLGQAWEQSEIKSLEEDRRVELAFQDAGIWPTEEDRFNSAVERAGAIGDFSGLANYLLAVDKPVHPEIAHAIGFILLGHWLPTPNFGDLPYRVEAVRMAGKVGRPAAPETEENVFWAVVDFARRRARGQEHCYAYEDTRLGGDLKDREYRNKRQLGKVAIDPEIEKRLRKSVSKEKFEEALKRWGLKEYPDDK